MRRSGSYWWGRWCWCRSSSLTPATPIGCSAGRSIRRRGTTDGGPVALVRRHLGRQCARARDRCVCDPLHALPLDRVAEAPAEELRVEALGHFLGRLGRAVQHDLGMLRRFERAVDTGEVLDLARTSPLVEP